jgi:hypothetical protein
MLKRMVYMLTVSKDGGAALVRALLVGEERNTDNQRSKFGLSAGLLKATQ